MSVSSLVSALGLNHLLASYLTLTGLLRWCFQRVHPPQGLMLAKSLQSCPTLCDPWTVAHQAPLSMGFSRQESWSGLPCLPPGDLPDPEIEPESPVSPALAGRFFTTNATWESHFKEIDRDRFLTGEESHIYSRKDLKYRTVHKMNMNKL